MGSEKLSQDFDVENIINKTPSCLKIVSKEGLLLHMNPQGLRLIESPDFESVNGANVYDIVHPEFRDSFIKFNEMICQGNSGSLSFKIVGLQGTERWMQTFASPYQLESGETAHIAITNDITEIHERKLLDEAINEIRGKFIEHKTSYKEFFDYLLKKLISLTESEYGFIGEILENSEGDKFLKTYAITDVSWNADTRKFYEEGAPTGLEFTNLSTLFGEVIKTQKPIITNEAPKHPKAAGIPAGHPPLDNFLGIPLFFGDKFIAMAGIANRKHGYSKSYYKFLEPIIGLIGQLIGTFHLERSNMELLESLKTSNHYLDMAIAGTGLGIWEWYLADNSVKFDKGWAEMLGLDVNEIPMELATWESRVHPEDIQKCYDDIKAYMDGKSEKYQNIHRMKHANGHWVYILDQGRFSEFDDKGNPVRFTGTHLDITKQKSQEEELLKARNSAVAAEKAKTDFLANMSHEIRTPMNGLLGMIELLRDTELTRDQLEYLNSAEDCGRSLMDLLNDILDISKIEAGKIEIEKVEFNLFELINRVIKILSFQALSNDSSISFDNKLEANTFLGDPVRIRQILMNLVSNAVKFTEHGEIKIVAAYKNGKLILTVSDSGIGINPGELNDLFESYKQANSRISTQYGGTGLGLAISKKLAILMNGDIKVDSEKGKGSTFTVEIELEQTEKQSGQEINFESEYLIDFAANFPARILIAEDNLVNQKVICSQMKKLGYEVVLANNGQEAIDEANKQSFDIILMDMRMPIMDGIEATKAIIEKLGGSAPKIIAVTANAFQDDKKACLEAGMIDFMTKPIKIDSLQKMLQKHLSQN